MKYRNRRLKNGRMFNVTYNTWKLWFNDAKHTLGIHDPKLTTHCTRHTCATRLAGGNMSLAVIMTYGAGLAEVCASLPARSNRCFAGLY